jgi:hypothetical protein
MSVIVINTIQQLEAIGNDPAYPLNGNYVFGQDIDASGFNFTPMGTGTVFGGNGTGYLTGTFDGQGHAIKNLTIDWTGVTRKRLSKLLIWGRGVIPLIAWCAIFSATAFYLLLLLKTGLQVDLGSDHIQNVLEVNDILHGNVFLHGWNLAEDNYYFTDNPFFLIARLLFGHRPVGIYFAPFLGFVMLLATMVGIVHLSAPDSRSRLIGFGAILFYVGLPGMTGIAMVSLFVGAVHGLTFAYCLLAWLALEKIERDGSILRARGFAGLLVLSAFIALFSDPFAIFVFLAPTLIGLFIALDKSGYRLQLSLIATLIAVFIATRFALWTVGVMGGFTITAGPTYQFVGVADLGRNALGVLFGLMMISEGYLLGRSFGDPETLVALVRFGGLLLVFFALRAPLRRAVKGPPGWNLPTVLAMAVLADVAACLMSQQFASSLVSPAVTGAPRYLVPAALFGGMLAALELPKLLARIPVPGTRWGLAGFFGAGLAVVSVAFVSFVVKRWNEPIVITQRSAWTVAQWLVSQGFTHGVGTYWESNIVAALTGERLTIGAIEASGGQLKPLNRLTNTAWYREPPQFVIFNPTNGFNVDEKKIVETYGPLNLVRIEHVAGYEIAVLTIGAGIFGRDPN